MDRRSGYLGASRLEYLDSAHRKKTTPKKFPIVVLLARNARFDSEGLREAGPIHAMFKPLLRETMLQGDFPPDACPNIQVGDVA